MVVIREPARVSCRGTNGAVPKFTPRTRPLSLGTGISPSLLSIISSPGVGSGEEEVEEDGTEERKKKKKMTDKTIETRTREEGRRSREEVDRESTE